MVGQSEAGPHPLALYTNLGNGVFESPATIFNSHLSTYLRTMDINEDGVINEFVAGRSSQRKLHWYRYVFGFPFQNLGTATLPHPFHSLKVIDMDGDGVDEVVGIFEDGDVTSFFAYSIFHTSITLEAIIPLDISPALNLLDRVTYGDVDDDGIMDIVCGYYSGPNELAWFRGLGDYTFSDPISLPLPHLSRTSPLIVDLDSDGSNDLLVAYRSGNDRARLGIFYGRPDGTLEPLVSTQQWFFTGHLQTADLNNDGRLDVLYLSHSEKSKDVGILLGQGTRGLSTPHLVYMGYIPLHQQVGDIDGNGSLDLFCLHGWDGLYTYRLSDCLPCAADFDGSGTIDADDLLQLLGAWGECTSPCVEDLNGDHIVGSSDLLWMLGRWGDCD